MSGGGSRVCKGKMGSAVVADVDPKAVEEWQKQLDAVSCLKYYFRNFIKFVYCCKCFYFFATEL